jgi:hypothetical protein
MVAPNVSSNNKHHSNVDCENSRHINGGCEDAVEEEEMATQQFSTRAETTTVTSSISTEQVNGLAVDERRFVWFQKDEEHKLRAEKLNQQSFEYVGHEPNALPASSRLDSKDFKDKVRAGGGAKGKTGSTDFTRGKNAFVRPCTVGWKSQNQPLMKGGGGRTPRQKG